MPRIDVLRPDSRQQSRQLSLRAVGEEWNFRQLIDPLPLLHLSTLVSSSNETGVAEDRQGASGRRRDCDVVRPQLGLNGHRRRRRRSSFAGPIASGSGLVGAMTLRERGRRPPRFERLGVAPAGDHQPGRALVGGTEQLETLEAVVAVDGSCPRSKSLGDFFAHLDGTVSALILITVMASILPDSPDAVSFRDPVSPTMTTARSSVTSAAKPGEVVGGDLPKLASGRGSWVVDVSGKKYLDGSGGPAVFCLGHSHPEVNEAIRTQLDLVAHAYRYNFTSDPLEELTELVGRRAGPDLRQMVFTCGGSEAVESALKIALHFHWANGEPTRTRFIARRRSWHGNTVGALSVSDLSDRQAPYRRSMLPVSHISPANVFRPPDGVDPADVATWCAAELESEIVRLGPTNVAARSSSSPWSARPAASCRHPTATPVWSARSATATAC